MSTVPDTITCPGWCVVPLDAHRRDLEERGGRVYQLGAWLEDDWRIASLTDPAGNPRPGPGEPPICVQRGDLESLPLNEAETLANSLLDLIRKARA